jgi:hypothetical protein
MLAPDDGIYEVWGIIDETLCSAIIPVISVTILQGIVAYR